MTVKTIVKTGLFSSALLISQLAFSHGLIESPPSRNYFCGVLVKPDQVNNPDVAHPECKAAFEGTAEGGYSFMSVLTHARGRLRPLPALVPPETPPADEVGGAVPPLATNVCGYDAETFGNGATPWDRPIKWPLNNMNPGRNKIAWNISWGPHFDDTQEFHYWITKPGFNYTVGQPLTWNDFETQPFCKLAYNHNNPSANPDVVADVPGNRIDTYCDVPARDGHHVIYGEWGRNYFTWERFHGCVDVQFGGGAPVVEAKIDLTPNTNFNGASTASLDGSASTGSGLSYSWSILSSTTDASYTFSDATAPATTITYTNPSATGDVSIALTVTSGSASNTTTRTLKHTPEGSASQWELKQALVNSPRTLTPDDKVSLRLVSTTGVDSYTPQPALLITAQNAAANAWPLALANEVNPLNGDVAIGVLNAQDQVVPVADATANNVYVKTNSNVASVFLTVEGAQPPGGGNCSYKVESEWGDGFNGAITITNNGTTPINGWTVNWSYTDGSTVNQLWNASLSGTYSATNLNWNGTIAPNASVEFGFSGSKGGSSAQVPTVTGTVCQ